MSFLLTIKHHVCIYTKDKWGLTKSCLLSLSRKTTCPERPSNSVVNLYRFHCIFIFNHHALFTSEHLLPFSIMINIHYKIFVSTFVTNNVILDSSVHAYNMSRSNCQKEQDFMNKHINFLRMHGISVISRLFPFMPFVHVLILWVGAPIFFILFHQFWCVLLSHHLWSLNLVLWIICHKVFIKTTFLYLC